MSTAYQYYVITLLVYFGVNTIAVWALNLQYGVSGRPELRLHHVPGRGRLHRRRAHARPGDRRDVPAVHPRRLAALPAAVVWRGGRRGGAGLVVGAVRAAPRAPRLPGDGAARRVDHRRILVVSQGSWFNGQSGLAFSPIRSITVRQELRGSEPELQLVLRGPDVGHGAARLRLRVSGHELALGPAAAGDAGEPRGP